MEQSNEVYHLYANDAIGCFVEGCGDALEFDTRNKIENLDRFMLGLRDIVNAETYSKIEEYLRNYLKFENN